MKLRLKIFKHDQENKINEWLGDHEHQLIDQRGTHVMENAIIFAYDAERIKVEAPEKVTATPAQTIPPDRGGKTNPTGLIQMLKNLRATDVETRVKLELVRRSHKVVDKKDISLVANVKSDIGKVKDHIEKIDGLIKDLEDGKLEEILDFDPNKPEIVLTK